MAMQEYTTEQLEAIGLEAKKELARKYYDEYVVQAHNGAFQHMQHTRYIADILQRIADGEQMNVVIEIPPRHGKSMLVTETFPSYYLGRHPDHNVMAISNGDQLATKSGRLNKMLFRQHAAALFNLSVAEDRSAHTEWGVQDHRGGMLSSGIAGSITGNGANLMIIDDPIRNREQAFSETWREKVWGEWETTLSTRLQDNASVIVIMTRWHEDDLIGRLLERSPRDWQRVRIPAIAEDEDDLLGRSIGEPLAPELGFDTEWAAMKEKEVGPTAWASMFQQRPTPAGGNIFKKDWIQYYDAMPPMYQFDRVISSWDLAFKKTSGSDFVAGGIIGTIGADAYLLDVTHDRYSFAETTDEFIRLHDRWPEALAKLVEDKANGPAVMSALEKKVPGMIPIEPYGSKEARAHAVQPIVRAKNLHLPRNAAFTPAVVKELTQFPNAPHDDLVDMITQALDYLYNGEQVFFQLR